MKTVPGAGSIGVALSLYIALNSAATVSYSTGESSDITFQWGVPHGAASSGSGNVYFQLEGPDTYSWVGLGIGSGMTGAQIFVVYQDGNGNVTLSTRQGNGHIMPQHTEMKDVELLQGSGVVGGKMVANVRCGSCDLDLSGDNSWISAWKSGDSMDSTNLDAPIQFHDGKTAFDVDFSKASINSDANPFLGSNGSGRHDGAVTESEGEGDTAPILLAHGVIMTITFVVMYPIGAMLMPLLGKWFIHAGWQVVAFLLMWAGFALGYVYAERENNFFDQTHTRMGTIVVVLLVLQPVLGWLHHLHYTEHHGRGIISHIHIWYGRILMIIGIVNGGLGLQLAGTTGGFVIAYSVVAGVLTVAYLGSIGLSVMKKGRRTKKLDSPAMEESR